MAHRGEFPGFGLYSGFLGEPVDQVQGYELAELLEEGLVGLG